MGGETALEMACSEGNEAIVKQLLDQKFIHVDHKNLYGNTCLELASTNGFTKIVNMLLERGADPNIKSKYSALHRACSKGYVHIVKKLVEFGSNVNAQNKYGETSLIKSAESGHIEVVDVLLNTPDLKINVQNGYGNTALSRAILRNQFDVFCALMRRSDIDLTLRNKNRESAFDIACKKKRTFMAIQLLKLNISQSVDFILPYNAIDTIVQYAFCC